MHKNVELLTDVNSVQRVADERTATHVNHISIDDKPTHTADETPLYSSTPANQADVPVPADVQLLTWSDLTQPSLPPDQGRQCYSRSEYHLQLQLDESN